MSDADGVNYDLIRLCLVGLVQRLVRFAVSRAIGKHDEDFGYPVASAVSRGEHPLTCRAKCRCNVSLPAIDVDVVDGSQQRATISVSVEMEDDFHTAAKL